MLRDASIGPDDNLELDGHSVSEIIVIARLLSRTEEQMRIIFEIHDSTASFKVIFYQKDVNSVPTALKGFEYKAQTYVKIFGNIRVYKEEKAIVGNYIKGITQMNETTNHFLNVFVSH